MFTFIKRLYLGVQPLAKELSWGMDGWMDGRYIDDATLGGSPASVRKDFHKVRSTAGAYVLNLNPSKCALGAISV